MDQGTDRPRSEPPPAPPEPEKYERPDWLVGADEIMPAEPPPREAPAAPPSEPRASAPPPSERSAPSAAGAPGHPPESPFPGKPPSSAWKMPTNDLISGPDMYDFCQDTEAAAAPEVAPRRSSFESEFESPRRVLDETGPATPQPDPPRPAFAAASPPAPPPQEAKPPQHASWIQSLKRIRIDRRVIVGVLVVVAAAAVWMAVANALSFTPIGRIRRNPDRFDGVTVKVRGTVGEVYSLGSSCTYYLMDGRDTIVVFSRARAPRLHDKITLFGSVSTGYLEGVPRVALFEETH